MNSIIILSQPSNLSHIAILLDDKDLNTITEFAKSPSSFKTTFYQLLSKKPFYTHTGERADFKEIISDKNITLILNYNEELHKIHFSFKDEESGFYEDFIQEYGEEDFYHLLKLKQAEQNFKNQEIGENNATNSKSNPSANPTSSDDNRK